jgi:glycosyltransferase involved in cell wall biosynthesis
MKKKIIYYARICYLDAALEYIKLLSTIHDVCVLIELSQNETKSNILNLQIDISKFDNITPFNSVVDSWELDYLVPYFKDCLSVDFVIYRKGKNIFDLLKTTQLITKRVKALNTNFIHFDDFSTRQSLLIPMLIQYSDKIIMNIHDPKSHSGESIWYTNVIKNIIYKLVKKFVVFSKFSEYILRSQVSLSTKIYHIKLLPYTIFKGFTSESSKVPYSISFIGRLSEYKGIDIFIDAAKKVNKLYPKQMFIIAGKSVYNYRTDFSKLNGDTISVIERHLTNREIAEIITVSKLVVCPYRDATQSGVIMSAYSLQRPVLVSNVGGLPEYVQKDTGIILKDLNANSLSEAIITFLNNNSFETMNKLIQKGDFIHDSVKHNISGFTEIYS